MENFKGANIVEKECPKCNGKGELKSNRELNGSPLTTYFAVRCKECKSVAEPGATERLAIQYWNEGKGIL